MKVDPKYHKHFVAKRGELLHEISDQYGGVTISFPRTNVSSDIVVIKGAKDCVNGAKQRILDIIQELVNIKPKLYCVISLRVGVGSTGSFLVKMLRFLGHHFYR